MIIMYTYAIKRQELERKKKKNETFYHIASILCVDCRYSFHFFSINSVEIKNKISGLNGEKRNLYLFNLNNETCLINQLLSIANYRLHHIH